MIKPVKIVLSVYMLLFLSSFSINASALKVLTVCDSITQGLQRTGSGHEFGIVNPVNGAANVGGYQPVLNQMLDANIEPSTVYNWGIGGEKSSQTVNRINSVLNSQPAAEYILILCGANDVLNGISSNTTKANISTMVDRSLAKGVTPIISELSPITVGAYDYSVWAYYNPKIRAVAAQKNVPLVYMFGEGNNANASAWVSDLRLGWKGGVGGSPPAYHSGDGLHLSNFGYVKMAEKWFDVIQQDYRGGLIAPILDLIMSE